MTSAAAPPAGAHMNRRAGCRASLPTTPVGAGRHRLHNTVHQVWVLTVVLVASSVDATTPGCAQAMVMRCNDLRDVGASPCLTCCGRHQRDLRSAGCSNLDTHIFCEAAASFHFGSEAQTVHTQPGPVHASPVILNDTVLFSTLEPDCAIYRLNTSTGDVLWRYSAPHRDTSHPDSSRCGLRTTPRISRTTTGSYHVHIASDNNSFIVLDAASGDVVWTRLEPAAVCIDSGAARPCEVYSEALVVPWPTSIDAGPHDVRIQGSEDGTIRAFDAASGEHIWNKTVGDEANGSPVVNSANGSQIVIAADDGYLYCLEVETGEECGRLATCGGMDTMPSVDQVDNILFYTCYYPPDPTRTYVHVAGWVAAVDMGTFRHMWINNSTGGIPKFSEIHRSLFVAYMDGRVASLDPLNGTTRWVLDETPTKSEFFGPLVVDGLRDLLYGANEHGTVVAINPHTGDLISSVQLGKTVANFLGPAISSDYTTLYVGMYQGSRSGKLVAVSLSSNA